MSTEDREAEVNSRKTLRWMAVMAHKYISILSDVARGVPIENKEKDLRDIYKLRLAAEKLKEPSD